MLRIEGSTKLNSNRKKVYINKIQNSDQLIKIEGLITNLENTELLCTDLYIPNISKHIEYSKEKKIVLKQSLKKNNYKEYDIMFIRDNYKKIIDIINK